MAFIKLDPEWVQLPTDKAEAEANKSAVCPEYLIGPLSLAERELVMNLLGAKEVPWGSIVMAQARAGLRGWRNVPGSVAFKADKDGRVTEEQLGMLDHRTLQEIAREVWSRSTLSEANRGN